MATLNELQKYLVCTGRCAHLQRYLRFLIVCRVTSRKSTLLNHLKSRLKISKMIVKENCAQEIPSQGFGKKVWDRTST